MKKRIIVIAVSILALLGLGIGTWYFTSVKKKPEITKAYTINLAGDELSLDSVKLYLKNLGNTPKLQGRQLFFAAIDEYKNKKNLAKADSLFKLSAQKAPTAQLYFEWGKVNYELKQYEKAFDILNIAEGLGYENPNQLFHKLSVVCIALKRYEEAKKYLITAVESGLSREMFDGNDLDSLREKLGYEDYLNIYSTYSDQSGLSTQEQSFANFSKLFKPINFPVEWKNTGAEEQETPISFEFEKYITEMRHAEKFSRMVGYSYYSKGKIKIDSNYYCVVYKVADYMSSPMIYQLKLAVFKTNGTLVDKMLVGGLQQVSDNYKTIKITDARHFELNYFTHTEKDNEIVPNEKQKTEYFEINKAGKIVKMNAPV